MLTPKQRKRIALTVAIGLPIIGAAAPFMFMKGEPRADKLFFSVVCGIAGVLMSGPAILLIDPIPSVTTNQIKS